MEDDKILTIEEVASYLQIPKQTLYFWAREGNIPAIKVGKHWRFKKSSLDNWIQEKEKDNKVKREKPW